MDERPELDPSGPSDSLGESRPNRAFLAGLDFGIQAVSVWSREFCGFRTGGASRVAAACAMGALGVGVLLTGCAGQTAPWRKSHNPPPRVPSEVVVQRAVDLWRPRLGVVALVDKEAGFALIDIGTAPAPSAGTALKSFTLDKEAVSKAVEAPPPTAELVVSAFQKRPFLIADLKSGLPKVGDSVVSVDRSGAVISGPGSASPKPSGDHAKEPKAAAGARATPRGGEGQAANPPVSGGVEAVPGLGAETSPSGASGSIIPGIAPKPSGGVPLQ